MPCKDIVMINDVLKANMMKDVVQVNMVRDYKQENYAFRLEIFEFVLVTFLEY